MCLGVVLTSFTTAGNNHYTAVMTLSSAQVYSTYTGTSYASSSYNCSSIRSGMYFSNQDNFIFLITNVNSQSNNTATIVLEDINGINALLSPGTGIGAPKIGTLGYIFQLNSNQFPLLFDITTAPSPNWATSIISRFMM